MSTDSRAEEFLTVERLRAAALHALAMVPEARTPLVVLDRRALAVQVALWRECLPDVEPFYAIKANNHRVVLEELSRLGLGFDAATGGELDLLRPLGLAPERLLATHPIRDAADLRAVARDRPAVLVVQDASELRKLRAAGVPSRDYAPTILVRVALPFSNLNKFGVRVLLPDLAPGRTTWSIHERAVLDVIDAAREVEREVGVRFAGFGLAGHVGTNCHNAEHFRVMLALFRLLHELCQRAGVQLATFDLGGGFCDQTTARAHGTSQSAVLQEIGQATAQLREHCPGVRLVAEPGRFFVADAAAIVATVKSVQSLTWRTDHVGNHVPLKHLEVHIDDGIYGTLMGQAHDDKVWDVQVLRPALAAHHPPASTIPAHIWGATCDSYDRIHGLRELPSDLGVGDRLFVPAAGAYSLTTATRFNQAAQPCVWAFGEDPEAPETGTLFDTDGASLFRTIRPERTHASAASGVSPKNRVVPPAAPELGAVER
ncbi:MAG: hypothetical protein HUU28_04135 [Planctomycetaceae bacterium]|nr:hypothetical protein [Planctomycetaceae bacterium]